MVAGMPMILIRLEDRSKLTKVQLVIFGIMAVILVCGIFLFTNFINFESAHFEVERTLTIVESVYFLAQVLTTVGYGDVTPADPKGQVFVALYVLFSLLIIANVISEVQECIAKHARQFGEDLVKQYQQAQDKAEELREELDELVHEGSMQSTTAADTAHKEFRNSLRSLRRSFFSLDPPRLDYKECFGNAAQFLCFVVLGCIFFISYPGENKTPLEAIYMSVITLSTVGFGAVTPQTEAGKVFSAFWMLFGSAALVGMVGALTSLYDQIKNREHFWTRDLEQEQKDFFDGLPAEMDMFQFMKACLLFRGLVPANEIKALEDIFELMEPDEDDGKAPKATLEELIADYRARKDSLSSGPSLASITSTLGLRPSSDRSA
jgi:ABC-type multidrug transport system fused ATPase/permease subunit